MKINRKKLRSEVTISVFAHTEQTEIKGNAIASGDDKYDAVIEKRVAEKLKYNNWAWCCVEVKVTWNFFETSVYLGCCSYDDEEDFKTGGYYEDMVNEAVEEIAKQIEAAYILSFRISEG